MLQALQTSDGILHDASRFSGDCQVRSGRHLCIQQIAVITTGNNDRIFHSEARNTRAKGVERLKKNFKTQVQVTVSLPDTSATYVCVGIATQGGVEGVAAVGTAHDLDVLVVDGRRRRARVVGRQSRADGAVRNRCFIRRK